MQDKNQDVIHITIDDDPTTIRGILEEIINQLRGPEGKPKSREQSLAVTKLQEARYWLGEDMFGFKPETNSIEQRPVT